MARLSAEEMFKNMIGRKDEEPQPAQETAVAPTAEKKKASTVQVTVQPSTATAICLNWYGRHSISFLRNFRKY